MSAGCCQLPRRLHRLVQGATIAMFKVALPMVNRSASLTRSPIHSHFDDATLELQ